MTTERAGSPAENVALYALGGQGPDALLLHGFGSDHLLWLANQQAIGAVATASALDLPGHGDSSMDVDDGTPFALAALIAAALDDKGLSNLHLVGHSLGGGVALTLAEARPDLVSSLVLISAAGLGASIDMAFLSDFPRLESAEAATILLQRLVNKPSLINGRMVARVLQQLEKPGSRQALSRIVDGLAQSEHDLAAAAEAVKARDVPRMVVWGEKDRISPMSRERIATFGGEAFIVENAGHLPHVEAARLANDKISDFLARQIGGSRG